MNQLILKGYCSGQSSYLDTLTTTESDLRNTALENAILRL